MESAVDKRNTRRPKRVAVKQEFREFSIAAAQFPAEIVVLQQFEYIGDAGQPGKLLAGFRLKKDVSGQRLRLLRRPLSD